MVDVHFVEEQLKELAIRSREKAGFSKWTGLNEFFYRTFTASQILELTETINTLQSSGKMLSNLEDNLEYKDYEVLEKEERDDRVLLYIRTLPHLASIGNGALITVELKDKQARISIYEHDISFKSIDTYDLMDYIAQTIVAPSKRSRELIVNKDIYKYVYGMPAERQVEM